MTEFEKKRLLSVDEYNYLMEYFGGTTSLTPKPIIKQINYYFDTDDLSMNEQNITCRIRLKDGKYKGTIKQHSLNSDHNTETEIEIYDGINRNAFTNMGLKLQGELFTERCIIFKDAGCEVVLDKNQYLGYIDYELEIEYSVVYEKEATLLFHTFIEALKHQKNLLTKKKYYKRVQNTPSKSNRFFERMKNEFNT